MKFKLTNVLKILSYVFLFLLCLVLLFFIISIPSFRINGIILLIILISIIILNIKCYKNNRKSKTWIIFLGFIIPFVFIYLLYIVFIAFSIPILFLDILSIIILVFSILTAYKIYTDYIKYGNKIFKFKSDISFTEMELISKDVEKINTYQKIITLNNKIVVINKSGIFEILKVNKGILEGYLSDRYWLFNNTKVNNPFKYIGKNMYNYFIIDGDTVFKTDAKMVSKSNIYFEISKYLNKNVYNNNEIDNIYNDIINECKQLSN